MNKFLIKAPAQPEKMMLTFPFLHLLDENYPGSEINIIIDEDALDVYDQLQFKVNVYRFPKGKLSLLGIHHFSYNLLDVFNIDKYFDFENTFKSSFMGFTFRCHERIGRKTGLNSIWLHKKIESPSKDLWDKFYLEYLEKNNLQIKIVGVKESSNVKTPIVHSLKEDVIVDEQNPEEKELEVYPEEEVSYILIITETDQSWERWETFIDSFVSQKFIFFLYSNLRQSKESEIISKIISRQNDDNDNNLYEVVVNKELKEMREKIIESVVVVSDIFWAANLASYLNKESFALINHKRVYPFIEHFQNTPNIVKLDGNTPVRITTAEETKRVDDMSQVVDFLHEKIGL